MTIRPSSTVVAALVFVMAAPAPAQTVQYKSPAGVEYKSQKDTGTVARAEKALAADPKNVDLIIKLGTAQAGIRDMRGAVNTFTKGLAANPNNALLYRWRGHRHLSLREFDAALDDFSKGLKIDSTVYGIWYHLGIVRFANGDFNGAADAFKRAQPRAPDAGELAGSTDWLWMSLSRAGKSAEAKAMLAKRPDSLKTDPEYGYTKRLRMYRGEVTPENLITKTDTADVQVATLNFGLGNYYLVKGDTAKARAAFEKSIKSGGWPGFGFIISEIELKRTARK